MPQLHEKNYFKSVKTLGLGLPSSLYTKVDHKAEGDILKEKELELKF
jgi:hypothetical protein